MGGGIAVVVVVVVLSSFFLQGQFGEEFEVWAKRGVSQPFAGDLGQRSSTCNFWQILVLISRECRSLTIYTSGSWRSQISQSNYVCIDCFQTNWAFAAKCFEAQGWKSL